MKPKLYSLITLSCFLYFLSCKTAGKLYQKGNYDEAVELAAKKLQKDPDDPKLLNIIRNAYQYALDDHNSRIRSNAESNNELKWEWTYNEYAALQRMYDAIYKVPAVFDIVRPVDYSSHLITYGEKAGDIRYDRGLTFMLNDDKESYRRACREFQAALFFKPGHRDVLQKMNEAYEYAVVNVIVTPMNEHEFRFSSYTDHSLQNFSDQLLRNLQRNTGNEFVRLYSTWEARSRNIRPDMTLDLRLTAVNIGQCFDTKNTRQISKDVLVKETVYRPDSVLREYAKVKADITTVQKNMQSDGLLQINIRDNTGRWLWRDNIAGTHNWSTSFTIFAGDERALDENDKQLLNRGRELPPSENEILRCIMQQLESNAQWKLQQYFRNI